MSARRVIGRTNYFIESESEQLAETIMFKSRVYHYLGFFEDNVMAFNLFFTEIGTNWMDFIYLESEIDFYGKSKSILIYDHERLVNYVFNNDELPDQYGFIRCSPDNNENICYDQNMDKYLTRTNV